MKKSLFIGALMLLGATSFAQSSKEDVKVEFNPHWFMQVQAGAAHTIGELKFDKLISPAAALSVGYQFTPVWGLRGGFSGWQSKGGWAAKTTGYKYKFLQVNVDAMADLNNWLGGYRYDRFFSTYLFAGIAYNHAFDNDEAVKLADSGYDFKYLWKDSRDFFVGRAGIGFNFRICDHVAFNIEGNANLVSDHYNSKKADNVDWQFNALAGFTFRFGKTHKKQEVVKEIPAPVVVKKEEPVREEPKPVVKEEPKPEVKALRENIFFLINSSVVRKSEEHKIAALAEYLKKNAQATISLTGYADKATGNANINNKLSKQRAEKVADALVAQGIDVKRIKINYKGDTEQPFATPEENRVTICITE